MSKRNVIATDLYLEGRISMLEIQLDESQRRLHKIEKFIDSISHGGNVVTAYRKIIKEEE